jgi:hemolysin activation/secretion protein
LTLAGLLSLTPLAFAQTGADPAAASRQADVIQRQNQERIQRDIEAARPRDTTPQGIDTSTLMPRVDASAAGKTCHEISVIAIGGAARLSPAVKEDITRRFAMRCLGVAEIEQILGIVTKDYIERGFVTTRAYLPAQDLKRGTLNILVIEGKLEAIDLDEGARKRINPVNVFPAPGGLLNLRDFEQGIDQVNKLSSNSAQLDILPGKEVGASRVLIRNAPRFPLHAGLSADNEGSASTGRAQAAVNLSADGLLHLNELMLLTHRRSQPEDSARKSSESSSFTFILPWGYTTMSYSGSRSSFLSTLVAPSGLDLQFRGKSDSDAWSIERLMYRDQTSRFGLSASLTKKDTKNYLAGEFLGVSSRALTVLDLGSNISTGLLGGFLSVDTGYARGLNMAGALADADYLPDEAPRAQFGKWKLGIGYQRPFQIGSLPAAWSTQFTAQHADDTLYGSEQLLIGGLYSVRGFVDHTLSGDHGWYARSEVSVRPTLNLGSQAVSTRLFAGLDLGRVRNRVADIPEGRLLGMAVGASGSWKGISLSVTHTRPLKQPGFFHRESPQTWVRANIDI